MEQYAIYLGLPTKVGRCREEVFRVLVSRVTKKLKDWKSGTLSQAGKITLVKSVVQVIPTYLMSCFRIPQGIVRKIHWVIAHFLWGQKCDEKRIHWMRWEVLCRPKSEGVLS